MSFLRKADYYAIGFISLFPLIFFLGLDLLYQGETHQSIENGLVTVVYSFLITVGLYVINSLIIRWLQLRHPWQNGAIKRIVLEAVLSLILSTAWQLFILVLNSEFFNEPENIREHYISNIIFGLTITFIVLLIMEGAYFFSLWRDSLTRVQRLEKQHLQAQLDQLRAQVQPHFLFNSLNTLSAMLEVQKDIPRAVKFIDEFSLLYRRLLEHRENELVTLSEEWRFVQAYLLLQKERFSSALDVRLEVPEEKMEDYILPLAVQELLENAIKHNRMSRSEPLTIRIYSEMSRLCISNPNRPKNNRAAGTGTGLENLRKRLRLLGAPSLEIHDGDPFTVCIPLIPADVANIGLNTDVAQTETT